jgi:hypothetical protein
MRSQLARLAGIGMGIMALLLTASAGLLLAPASAQAPRAPSALLGTAITYQGQLKRTGSMVTDTCSMNFRLYNQASGGAQVGSTLTQSVSVVAGLFAAALDFGNAAFNGDARWLNIQVKCSADASYVDLGLQALTAAPFALALPGLYTQPNATSPNVIGGQPTNLVASGVYGAVIGGGGHSGGENQVYDKFSTIGGGAYNVAGQNDGDIDKQAFATVGGGSQNLARAALATVGGGHANQADYDYSTIAGGQGNYGWSKYASIGGGSDNTAYADYSTVPGGKSARTSHYGELAYASGDWSGIGRAQTSLYVLRNSTTTSASTELFLDGSSQRITLADGRALVFEIQVVAVSDTGIGAGFRIWGVLRNYGGDTTMLGASGAVIGASPAASTWNAVASADNSSDALVVHVTGSNGVNIRWVATVRTTEVQW